MRLVCVDQELVSPLVRLSLFVSRVGETTIRNKQAFPSFSNCGSFEFHICFPIVHHARYNPVTHSLTPVAGFSCRRERVAKPPTI